MQRLLWQAQKVAEGPAKLTRELLALSAHEILDSFYSVNAARPLGVDNCGRAEIKASSGCSILCGPPGRTFARMPEAMLGASFRGYPPPNHL
jgi:hypothetical protein